LGTAAQIRALRIGAGRSKAEMVERLGLNAAWYEDLEAKDDELPATLTLFQGMELAALLGVTLGDLFSAAGAPAARIALVELPERMRAQMAREHISVEDYEERAGWSVSDFLDAPLQAAATLPILFFQSIASVLGVDWLTLIPDSED
jgi:transcriptional regulator with XRE-family HTH domain